MNQKEAAKYQLKYPHYLPWSRRIHVVRRGQLVTNGADTYALSQVVRSPINNEPPRVVLEPVGETKDANPT